MGGDNEVENMEQTQVQEQICRGAQGIGPGQATLGPQMAMAPPQQGKWGL